MSNQETQEIAPDAEAQALQEAIAGYEGKARAQAPAEPEKKEEAELLSEATPSTSTSTSDVEPEPDDEPPPPAEPAPPTEAEQLKAQMDDLKAHVRRLEANGADKETVRKMHGEIGEINRYVKQLATAKTEDAPAAEDRLAAALKKAEATATEFPEIGGPFFEAIKELQARLPSQPEPQETPPEPTAPPVDPQQAEELAARKAAIKALDEAHPDRHEIRESAEFKAWFKTKPAEYQKKVTSSWNPVVVAEPFTDFKAYLAARKRKQERLEAAETPQGLPRATPTTISDEEAARIGYERARGKRL